MKPIIIVPQKREFGCAKAVIKTIVKTRYGRNIAIRNPWFYIKSLGTLRILSMANDALHQNRINARFVKKTGVKSEELQQWLNEDKLMIVLFISRENYPHYTILADMNTKTVTIANTHGAKFEKYPNTEFIERFYLNTRYIERIEWMKGQYHPVRDRIIRLGIRLAKVFGIIKSGTVYVLEEKK